MYVGRGGVNDDDGKTVTKNTTDSRGEKQAKLLTKLGHADENERERKNLDHFRDIKTNCPWKK
jgi:hypothetical protein